MEELSLNTKDEALSAGEEDDQDETNAKLKQSTLDLATSRKKDKSQWSLF
jgi:hypothetical protein